MSHRPSPYVRAVRRFFSQKRSIILEGASPMNIVILRPILERLQRDSRIRLYLSAKFLQKDDPESMIRATGLRDVTPLKQSRARRFPADLYLSTDGSRVPGKSSYRRLLTFHGASFKGRTIAKKTRFFDKIMLVGPWQRRQFVARGYFQDNDPRFVPIGMPKLDKLAARGHDVVAIRRSLGIADHERVVLYAPTWGEQSSIFKMGEAMLEAASTVPNVRILVKLHDHLMDPTRSPIDWLERAQQWPWKNVELYRDIDVVPALAIADVLISDASSVIQEFMLLDRPVIYCDVPELLKSKRYKKTADTQTWFQKGGPVIKTGPEIVPALERSLGNPSEFSEIRRKIAEDVFYNPGTATEHALRLIYTELELERPEP